MKYSIALVALLVTTSFALDIPEPSFEGFASIKESLIEKYGPVAQDITANFKELFIKYNPLSLINNGAATEMTTQTIQKDNVIPAVSAMSLNNPSESSLFTMAKSYIMNRYTALTTALIVAVGGGALYYSKNK